MMIAVYDSLQPEKGWFRGGKHIWYYKSNVDHEYYKVDNEMLASLNNNNNNNGCSSAFSVSESPNKKDQNQNFFQQVNEEND